MTGRVVVHGFLFGGVSSAFLLIFFKGGSVAGKFCFYAKDRELFFLIMKLRKKSNI